MDYIEISTEGELTKFLDETVSFHDSLIKEIQMINRGYVQENQSMVYSHQFDARILVQSQWNPIAFELLCIDVKHFNITGAEEYWGGGGKVLETLSGKLVKLSLDDAFCVQCKKLFYKLTLEKFGNYEHLGSQVPTDKMIQAIHLDTNWWQCGNCSDAWQVDEGRQYATCPTCNNVVELYK